MKSVEIQHRTTYRYDRPVSPGPHQLYLRPREGHDIRIASSTLTISPTHTIRWHRDVYENSLGIVEFTQDASELSVHSEVKVEVYEREPLDFVIDDHAVLYPFVYREDDRVGLTPFSAAVYPDDIAVIDEWFRSGIWKPGQQTETFVLLDKLNKAIPKQLDYQIRETEGVQGPAETLQKRTGSCRDFATLFMESCRSLGLGARFVSGYLHAPATEQGNASTHAWSEVYLPGAGWKGFDSTTGEIVGPDHIAVAVHRHPESIPPVAGEFSGVLDSAPVLSVDVKVTEVPADRVD